jgi:lambda family phage portal protein
MSAVKITSLNPPSQQDALGGAYEGASRTSQEIALWSPASKSADADLLHEKTLLDARARDRIRNDGYISGATRIHQDSIVGGKFLLNAKPNLMVLSRFSPAFDETWEMEFQEEVEARFELYADSNENWLDAARKNNFTELVRLAVGIDMYSGEVLSTAEWLRDGGRPYSTAVQMIDVDRLSDPYDAPLYSNTRIRRGVEINRYGQPVAYHIRLAHPSDIYDKESYRWKRVVARKPWGRQQVIHIYEQNRPDQSRGVSDMVSALKQMKMTQKYQDIVLQNAVVNATYAATIESELPADAVYPQLGEGNGNWAEQYMSQIAAYAGGSKNLHIDGVKIPHLFPGTKLKMQSAGNPGGVGDMFEMSLLRHIAAALGLSYEQFSRDYTQTNYSSARASMLETWKRMQSRKRMIADRFANSIYTLFVEELINKGDLPLPAGVGADVFYQGQNKDAFCQCSWVGASRGQIDELKETQAAVMRIESGLSTYEEECSRLGRDFRDVFKQQAREKAMRENLGLAMSFEEQLRQAQMMQQVTDDGESKDEESKDKGSEDKDSNDKESDDSTEEEKDDAE